MFGCVAAALAGLQEPGDDHEADEDEVGECVEEAAGDRGGVLRQVHPEEVLRVRQAELREVALVGVEVALRAGAERGVQVGATWGCACTGSRHDAEEREEDRHLHQERQTTRERVDLVLLVELHHLFVELGAVVLVLRLELLDLRLRPLHGDHRLRLLRGEREQHQHHHDGEQDDRDPEVRDDPVEEREDRPEEVVDGIEDGAGSEDHRVSLLPPHRRVQPVSNVRSPGIGRRDGVEAAVVPGVAPAHAPDRQPAAARRAVDGERLERVLRARRVEAAPRREVDAHKPPRPDGQHHDARGQRTGARRGSASTALLTFVSWRTDCSRVVTCSRSVGKGRVMTDRSAAKR